jgi:hypothetical protein
MEADYSISKKYSNFSEGISEAKEADQEVIKEMLDKPHADIDFEALGRKLWDMAYSYMEQYAENQANEEFSSGNRD